MMFRLVVARSHRTLPKSSYLIVISCGAAHLENANALVILAFYGFAVKLSTINGMAGVVIA